MGIICDWKLDLNVMLTISMIYIRELLVIHSIPTACTDPKGIQRHISLTSLGNKKSSGSSKLRTMNREVASKS